MGGGSFRLDLGEKISVNGHELLGRQEVELDRGQRALDGPLELDEVGEADGQRLGLEAGIGQHLVAVEVHRDLGQERLAVAGVRLDLLVQLLEDVGARELGLGDVENGVDEVGHDGPFL